MPADLVAFLRARLDEDEQTARAALGHEGATSSYAEISTTETRREQAHTDRWTPARVLAEVDAKRRLLGLHAMDWRERPERGVGEADDPYCVACFGEGYPCETLRLLALPYDDHPDYRPEWRP